MVDPLVTESGVYPYKDALQAMRNEEFLDSAKYRHQQRRANRDDCHYRIKEFERALVRRMKQMGIPMFCSEMRRSSERQTQLYVEGFSKAKAGQSPHQYGMASDIIHSIKGWELTREQWALIGHVGKDVAASLSLKVDWGGDWKFYDPAHWQLRNWRNTELVQVRPPRTQVV